MSGHEQHSNYLIAKGILLGGGLTGIVELLPDGTVIKTPWPDDRSSDSQRDIRNEAQAYHRIAKHFEGHIRFVKLIEFDPMGHTLTMEYMPHGTLREYLKSNDHDISMDQRFLWIKAVAEGLDLLHSISIIHCDLTPRNMFLDSQFELKIADFGCCSIDQSTKLPSLEAVQCLLEHDWDINAGTPLLWCVISDHSWVEWCLANGAVVESSLTSAGVPRRPILEFAASVGNIETFEHLRSKGAEVSRSVLLSAVRVASRLAPKDPSEVPSARYKEQLSMASHLVDNVGIDVNLMSWGVGAGVMSGSPCSTPL